MKKTFLAAMALGLALTGSAGAQGYPTKPITMIIPFAAGGPTDVLGRVMAQRMGEILGQQVVVENVGGAGGSTGSVRAKNAAPGGYTIQIGTVGTHAQNQTLYKKPAYNSATDFTPVALIAEVPIILITRNDMPANNLKEFIAYAKANQADPARTDPPVATAQPRRDRGDADARIDGRPLAADAGGSG